VIGKTLGHYEILDQIRDVVAAHVIHRVACVPFG
jgi:hypothetical protein